MKFEEGITYLRTIEVESFNYYNILYLILIVVFMIIYFSLLKQSIISDLESAIAVILISIIGFGFTSAFITLAVDDYGNASPDKYYEVRIDDTVSFEYIIKRYDIISVDGDVITITEKQKWKEEYYE